MFFKSFIQKCRVKDESGGITIFCVIWITVVLGIMILCLDIGKMIITKHELQSVADAAALAGASTFVLNYELDMSGNIVVVKPSLDKAKADIVANVVLSRNVQLKNFISQDIKIMSTQTKTKDVGTFGLPEYSIKIGADVKMFILGAYDQGITRVTVISRADVNLN